MAAASPPAPSVADMHSHCLLCGGRVLDPVRGYEQSHLVRCASCDFVFAARVPSHQELEDCYVGKYEEHREGYQWLSPITSKRLYEWLDGMVAYRKLNRLLDVGCGAGHFLERALDRGWEAHGTEFASNAVERCREKGIRMMQGPLQASAYEPESFDVITSLGVIEHVSDPRRDITEMVKLLRPGGLLFVTTPNFDSLSRDVLKAKWNVIAYPEHLSYFTPKTLRSVMSRAGLREDALETTGLSVSRIATSLRGQQLAYVTPSSADEQLRTTLESRPSLLLVKKGINRLLTLAGKGDELKAQFVKPS